jgi:hypothetical protein
VSEVNFTENKMNASRSSDKIVVEIGQSKITVSEEQAQAFRCCIAAQVVRHVPKEMVSRKPRLKRMEEDAGRKVAGTLAQAAVTAGKLRLESCGQSWSMSGADGLRLWRALDALRTDITVSDVESVLDIDDLLDDDFKLTLN